MARGEATCSEGLSELSMSKNAILNDGRKSSRCCDVRIERDMVSDWGSLQSAGHVGKLWSEKELEIEEIVSNKGVVVIGLARCAVPGYRVGPSQ